jgi:predicted MPP superfamily phosphohydrolase
MSAFLKKCIALLAKPGVWCLALLLILLCHTIWSNCALTVTTTTVTSSRLPAGFSGFRIAQVSDLHNARFGDENQRLLSLLRQTCPDIIVITGDLVDSYSTDLETALDFAAQAVLIAPCYYVPGNHEARIDNYDVLRDGLAQAGVGVLENQRLTLQRNGDSVTLIGLTDPSFRPYNIPDDEPTFVTHSLEALNVEEGYTIVLSHRPELFHVYAQQGVDLVFSGHAHGGQFRLPLIGGLFAPNQGLFPKYDAGLYVAGDTRMLVSRGIGNSSIPFRFNNPPEITLTLLECSPCP